MKTTTVSQQYGTKSQGSSVKCGECRLGLAVDESEQLILCDNPDIKEWYGKNVKHDRNHICGHGIPWQENTMNITSVNAGAFANGFDYFCPNCSMFFSVQSDFETYAPVKPCVCPYCGGEELKDSVDGLLEYCTLECTDPINFYQAFPLDEPIPQSETGATPRQVKIIESLVVLDKQAKRPVTINSIAAQSDTPRETVEKVFDELHITETGGTE